MSFLDILAKAMRESTSPSPRILEERSTREERIAIHNKEADEVVKMGACATPVLTTLDFMRKARGVTSVPLSSLRSISLSELEVDKTHRGCAVYCRIASRVIMMSSAMVLVEDDNGAIISLAVYGALNRNELKEGRTIAIKEPFYKMRSDGTEGIRVDDPFDIVFDGKELPGTATTNSQ